MTSGRSSPVCPVADADGEVLRAAHVGAPGFEPMVRRMPRAAELEVRRGPWPARRRRARSCASPPSRGVRPISSMLAALAITCAEIGERPVRLRHAGIVLLDAPAHFGDQRLLQRLRWAEQALGVAVLRLQIRPDLGIEQRRDRAAPAASCVLQPGIVVDHSGAMQRAPRRPPRRDRRRGRSLFASGGLRVHGIQHLNRRAARGGAA